MAEKRREARTLLERLVPEPLATHRAAVVRLVRRVARTPEHHDEADRRKDDEREHEGDLAFDGEHVEKSVTHSLIPLRPLTALACAAVPRRKLYRAPRRPLVSGGGQRPTRLRA